MSNIVSDARSSKYKTRARMAALSCLAMCAACSPGSRPEEEGAGNLLQGLTATVSTTTGTLQGSIVGPLAVFKGIPYAQPPTGSNRFKPTVPKTAWSGTRFAQAYGNRCPQTEGTAVVGNEDCLFLNIWAPTSAGSGLLRPVMVYIHGGAGRI